MKYQRYKYFFIYLTYLDLALYNEIKINLGLFTPVERISSIEVVGEVFFGTLQSSPYALF
jgi:hypothetical protein